MFIQDLVRLILSLDIPELSLINIEKIDNTNKARARNISKKAVRCNQIPMAVIPIIKAKILNIDDKIIKSIF